MTPTKHIDKVERMRMRQEAAKTEPLVYLNTFEDEMIVLHQSKKWAATLYATCPEQARDFVSVHGRHMFPTVEKWEAVLKDFKKDWRSAYPDED